MKIKKLLSAVFIVFLFNDILVAQTFPAGFSQVKVASLPEATSMRIAPDGRIFVCQRDGTVNVIKNGTLLPTPFVKLTTDQNGERGVGGICFDPNFTNNGYVYIYYTATTPTIHNRLSRFMAMGDVAMTGAGSEVILLEGETLADIYHTGGGLDFGKDGKLYLSMGEDNSPYNAQNLAKYKGKLLRLNPDGSTPSDNPYSSSPDPVTQKIWNIGLRNPYTLAVQPGTGRIFVNNVGADNFEEIHDGTESGQNFGWPIVEGFGADPAYANPIFAFPHEDAGGGQKGCANVGGTFFNPSSTNYPGSYQGKYFYMDFCNGWMYYLTPTATSFTNNTLFATGLTTQNLALQVGPDGNLYYLNRYNTKAGVWKIIYNNNNPPGISSQPVSLSVPQSQPASFTASATGAVPLTYKWKKDGVDIPGTNSATYTIPVTQFTDAGQYTVEVSNSYGTATSNAATLTVTATKARPVATITAPSNGANYRAGDVINFSGSATDAEDGAIPASGFEWTVEFWHNNNHNHPGATIPPGVTSGSFTIPNTGETSPNTFYRIRLKVTDSDGLIDTPFVDLAPLKSTIIMNTVPSGLKVIYDGQPKTTPFSVQAVRGMIISISAVQHQNFWGQGKAFNYWQQGGAITHTIKVGEADSTYIAVFKDTTAVSIREFSENAYAIKLFPNPTYNKRSINLSITGYENGHKPVKVFIYDVSGKLMYMNEVPCDNGCVESTINLDNRYSPGTYLVDVVIEGKRYHQWLGIQ